MDPLSNTLSSPVTAPVSDAPRKLSSQAFEELFLSTYPRLVGLLRRMLGDSGRAEEIANEAFLKLHNTALPPSVCANVPGWLYRTAMNLAIDDLRARSRHTQVAQAASAAISSTTQPENGLQRVLRAETQQRVRLALSKLKPEWAQLLLLRTFGYSYKEIAAHLEVSATSVGTLLLRAEAGFEKSYLVLFGEKD